MIGNFVWGDGGKAITPDEAKRRREIAMAMIQQGTANRPIQHWAQGAANVAQALMGAYDMRQTDKQEAAAREASNAEHGKMMSLLGGGQAAPAPPPQDGVSASPDMLRMIEEQNAQAGLPPGYLTRTAQIESGMNPSAKNPNSSATGLFQFIDSTRKQYGGFDPMDPAASTQAAARLASDNRAALVKALGREPNAGELYLAHQQGAGGASKLLANPNARAVDLLGANAVRLNGGDENMTAEQFASKWTGKFGDGASPAAPQAAPVTPVQQVAQANPQLLQAAVARMNDPYASPGSRAVAQALVQRLVTQETKDPLDIERKQLELQKLRNDLSNSGMTKRQQELAIQKAEKDLETKPNIEIIRDAATGEVIAIDKNNIKAGIQKLREGGPSSTAPTTKTIKQPDGSEVAVQWNPTARAWEPLKAPEGGNAVKAPGKLTEQQSKDLVYYNRGSQALAQLDKVGSDALASTADVAKSKIPGVGNMLVSEKFQQARQAGTNFLASILRKDSGAAITVPEEEIYGRIFLPQPGDGLAVLSQKTEARRQAMDAIRTGLGPAEVLALGERLIKPENAKTPKPDGASAAPGTGPRIISVEPIR